MISRKDLRTDLPPIIETNGYTNVVLALRSRPFYYEDEIQRDNTYIPCWDIVNTVWYNKHATMYHGWIEIEYIKPEDL